MALFSNIKGQGRVISVISSHLKKDNLSHSYLFLGSDGFGKEYLSKEFARYILCGNKKEDQCSGCLKFKKGAHPDLFFIDGKDGIKIDQVRDVIERVNLTPSFSEKKVLIITKLENMGIEAANALLKTLEEPPRDTVILITARSEKVIPETIISRSQVFKLNKLSQNQVRDILLKEYPEEKVTEVVRISGGGLGESLELLSNSTYLKKKKMVFSDAIKLITSKSVLEKFKIIEEYDKKKEIKELFGAYVGIIQDIITGNSSAMPEIIDNVEPERIKRISQKILKIYANLEYNVSLRIALEEIILEDDFNA
jgi:DNA polymerase III subunit delta'